ncbi:MAG: DUF4358 domain-containing protein [Clostridia bacterium]|nr:DUF4358 domain-containing protein [Clostridia bacterium]
MKRILFTLLSISLLFSLVSCGESANYADGVSAKALSDTATAALGDGIAYLTAENGFFDDYFAMPTYVTDSSVRFAPDTNNLNEFGVFHVEAGKANDMKDVLKEYLSECLERNGSWYDSYIAQETPKLRDAEVMVFGNYAVYAIASKEDRAAFFDAVENALKVE